MIVGAYDYHMILCKFFDPFIRPCKALVECKPDRLSMKSVNPDIGTLRGRKPHERVSQRVGVAGLSRSCLVMLSQMSLERTTFADVAQSKPIFNQLCMDAWIISSLACRIPSYWNPVAYLTQVVRVVQDKWLTERRTVLEEHGLHQPL